MSAPYSDKSAKENEILSYLRRATRGQFGYRRDGLIFPTGTLNKQEAEHLHELFTEHPILLKSYDGYASQISQEERVTIINDEQVPPAPAQQQRIYYFTAGGMVEIERMLKRHHMPGLAKWITPARSLEVDRAAFADPQQSLEDEEKPPPPAPAKPPRTR